jgi:putative ABC transport system ATP-binding protein
MDLSHTFHPNTVNAVPAIQDISLEVKSGEFITIVGSNGAGKSTLFNLIAGMFLPESGSILIDGEDVTDLQEFQRAAYIGRVFQDPFMGTAGAMSIAENLLLAFKRGRRLHFQSGVTDQMRAEFQDRVAKIGLGLETRLDAKVSLLSGGQRQALTLTMAVLGSPKLLLLDEHTASLDPSTADTILKLTNQVVTSQKITTLMITHDLRQALEYGHRLLMMDEGQIIMDLESTAKRSMSVQDLISRFAAVRNRKLADDDLLLVK